MSSEFLISPKFKNSKEITCLLYTSLADRTEYGMNPDKTEGGALISAFACEPETAVSEFALSKREYRELTGQLPAV